MSMPQRKWIHLATEIQQRLGQLQRARYREVLCRAQTILANVQYLQSFCHKLPISLERGWPAAARRLTQRLCQACRDLPYHLTDINRAVELTDGPVPSVKEVLAELMQLQAEFELVEYRPDGQLLVVTTEPIELEEVYLGAFEVRLYIPSLAEPRRRGGTYTVVALEPNPASGNSSVTHPHVSGEWLCEGDAAAAIQAALTSGRICDFFLLVQSVLTHYNPGSPYISLEDWDGRACSDCGRGIAGEDVYCCQSCDEEFCE